MLETVAKLVQKAPVFPVTESGSVIHDYFEQNENAEGVVLVDGEKPVGIMMRNDFYQKIGKQYGFTIYMRRNISLIMKSDIACVDISCDMAKLGFIAMNRSKDSQYDHIIVMEDGKYAGVISISEFLTEMSRTKEREIELLNNQQRILEQANEAEKKHSMEIELKNSAIKNLLDNAGQGFLSFGGDLAVSGEYSRECDEIFGYSIRGKNFLDIIREHTDDETILTMQNAFEAVFKDRGNVRSRIYLSILPREMAIGRKYIKAEYKAITNPAGKSVMIILTDITEKKALELKNAEEKNNVRSIIRAIGSKAEIGQAMDDLREYFSHEAPMALKSESDKHKILYSIFRAVHTMKGDFSLNSLHHTAEELHRLENALQEMLKNADTVSLDDIGEFLGKIDCEAVLKRDVEIITEALGEQYFEKDYTFTVSRKRLEEIEKEIRAVFKGEEQATMLQLFSSLPYPNIKDVIRNYSDYTRAVAEKLGKKLEDFEVSGQDVYINLDTYNQFTRSLVHIFRNIADHGIEDPEARVRSGKPESGRITCEINKKEDGFVLSICDDGKGIDIDAVKEKAIEKGICTKGELDGLSKEEILQIIFMDNFSTKKSVDMLSGRGVGLAAVRSAVEETGGTIRMDTQAGRFTRFEFAIPLTNGTGAEAGHGT